MTLRMAVGVISTVLIVLAYCPCGAIAVTIYFPKRCPGLLATLHLLCAVNIEIVILSPTPTNLKKAASI